MTKQEFLQQENCANYLMYTLLQLQDKINHVQLALTSCNIQDDYAQLQLENLCKELYSLDQMQRKLNLI